MIILCYCFATILAGALLGRLFKVWVVVPASLVVFPGGVIMSSLSGFGVFLSFLLAFGMVFCLDAGFAAALLIGFVPSQRQENQAFAAVCPDFPAGGKTK